jgi:glycogen debranching enzyme
MLLMLTILLSSPSACLEKAGSHALDVDWLSCRTAQIISGCQISGVNDTKIYTPDASLSYGAQWTRDFQYMVSGAAPGMLDERSIKQAVRYQFNGQRADGCMPDRVQADGKPVFSPGAASAPFADHAWDNGPFGVLLLTATMDAWPEAPYFCSLEPQARRALDFVNRSTNALVYNDEVRPNCTYGFTDTVAKTGNLLFTSLLYYDASSSMARHAQTFRCGDHARYAAEAAAIRASIDTTMADPTGGPLWLAATVDNKLPDVWGSAYLVSLGLSTPERRRSAVVELLTNNATYFRYGQLRHTPYPSYWDRCFGAKCPPHGVYQNGAYWATPMSYVTSALIATGYAEEASKLLEQTIDDFRRHGIYEDVDRGHPATSQGVLNYTASATNVLRASRMVLAALQRRHSTAG